MHAVARGRAAALRTVGVAALLVVIVHPAPSSACAVCFSAASVRVLGAYHLTAALLTLLPLALVATFALWLRRRLRQAAQSLQA